jgi:phage baseplate assembly protein W
VAKITHIKVRDGDNLEFLAGQYLGDPSRWIDIVELNKLRSPFISNDHIDQLGPLLSFDELEADIPAGSTVITLPLLTPSLAVKHGTFHLHQLQSDGSLVCNNLTLAGPGLLLSDNFTQLTFTTPTTVTFVAGTSWFLYPNPFTITTKVLRTGDTLVLPDPNTFQQVEDESAEFARLLGSDVEINEKTRKLHWDSKKHDFRTVSGVANMHQAIKLRLSTFPGELLYHPAYGNDLLNFVGRKNTALFQALAAGIIHTCLNQDIRIYSVERIKVTTTGDVATVDLATRIKNVQLLLEVKSLGLPI